MPSYLIPWPRPVDIPCTGRPTPITEGSLWRAVDDVNSRFPCREPSGHESSLARWPHSHTVRECTAHPRYPDHKQGRVYDTAVEDNGTFTIRAACVLETSQVGCAAQQLLLACTYGIDGFSVTYSKPFSGSVFLVNTSTVANNIAAAGVALDYAARYHPSSNSAQAIKLEIAFDHSTLLSQLFPRDSTHGHLFRGVFVEVW